MERFTDLINGIITSLKSVLEFLVSNTRWDNSIMKKYIMNKAMENFFFIQRNSMKKTFSFKKTLVVRSLKLILFKVKMLVIFSF
jgi:hypothetical protein